LFVSLQWVNPLGHEFIIQYLPTKLLRIHL
jgi:hypothetical protein